MELFFTIFNLTLLHIDVEGFFGLQTTLILKHGGSSTKDLLHQQVKAIAANPKEKSLVKITVYVSY